MQALTGALYSLESTLYDCGLLPNHLTCAALRCNGRASDLKELVDKPASAIGKWPNALNAPTSVY
ncbi:hypothetical protein TYRP_016533 [Tyrophagus putrescentiae]|nr:hypothetical protein TYRP_016533 [Tyrophagus putrescentiae]